MINISIEIHCVFEHNFYKGLLYRAILSYDNEVNCTDYYKCSCGKGIVVDYMDTARF